jgi:hypothetical protein
MIDDDVTSENRLLTVLCRVIIIIIIIINCKLYVFYIHIYEYMYKLTNLFFFLLSPPPFLTSFLPFFIGLLSFYYCPFFLSYVLP